MSEEKSGFQPVRVVAVINPASSNVERGKRQLGELEDKEYEIERIYARPGDKQYTFDALHKVCRPGDLITSLSGDGGERLITEFMMSDAAQAELQEAVFVPARAGNANDVAVSLNGSHSLFQILQKGELLDVSPLEATITEPDRMPYLRYMLGYISLGSSADAAMAIEHAKSRNRLMRATIQPLHEVVQTLMAMKGYNPFVLAHTDGQSEELTTFGAIRADRMAKHLRLHGDLSRRQYELIRLTDRTIPALAGKMIQGAAGRLHGELCTETTAFTVYTHRRQPISMQMEGDVATVPSGTQFAIDVAERSFQTLTTRWPKPA